MLTGYEIELKEIDSGIQQSANGSDTNDSQKSNGIDILSSLFKEH